MKELPSNAGTISFSFEALTVTPAFFFFGLGVVAVSVGAVFDSVNDFRYLLQAYLTFPSVDSTFSAICLIVSPCSFNFMIFSSITYHLFLFIHFFLILQTCFKILFKKK